MSVHRNTCAAVRVAKKAESVKKPFEFNSYVSVGATTGHIQFYSARSIFFHPPPPDSRLCLRK